MASTITAREIKEIRGKYGLSQKSFALLLGIGPDSMVRSEQGVQPTKANANLIRAARIPEFMQECLENDGNLIPEKQRVVAERISYALVKFEGETGEPEFLDDTPRVAPTHTMDEMYHYTLQQEILNEQAANLIADIISLKLSSSVSDQDAQSLDALLHQLSRLKPTIVRAEMLDDGKLSNVRGYLACATDLIDRVKSSVAL